MSRASAKFVWKSSAIALLLAFCWTQGLPAAPQDKKAAETQASEATPNRADSYYHYALAHLYQQLAMQYVRQEYLRRSLDEYRKAIELDPDSDYLRLELIDLFARTNRLDDAVTEAQKVLERSPKNIEVRHRLGLIYRRYASNGQEVNPSFIRSAMEQYEKIVEVDPKDPEALMQLAALYRHVGEREKAEKALKTLLEVKPDSTEAAASLAQLYLEAGEPDRAIKVLEEARAAGRADRGELLLLGRAYQQAGEHDKAAAVFQQVIEEGGNTLPARRFLADSLVLAGDYDKALEQYLYLAEAEPQNPENHLRLSQIYREKRRFSEAHGSLKKAAELDSDSLEIKYNLVLLLQQEGQNDDAVAAMKQLLADTAKDEYAPREKKNRALFFEQLGVLYRGVENYAEAQKAFQSMGEIDAESRPRALAHGIDTYRIARDYSHALDESRNAVDEFPDSQPLASLRATVLAETGNVKEAAKVLKGQLKGNSDDREVYLALAQVYEKGKQYDKAIEAVEKAQGLSKTSAEKLGVLFALGSVLERAKRFDEAEAKFTELLKLDPDNASALNYFGYMLADLNRRLNDAHDMIQKALDLDPNNGAYLDSLGWVYYRQERFDLAERYLLRSLEHFKQDPVVHSHLGDVYYKQGKVDQAQKHWKRSLEEWQRSAKSDQDHAEIMEVRKKLDSLALQLSSEATGSKEIKE